MFVKGHDEANDDLFGPAPTAPVGPSRTSARPRGFNPLAWGGHEDAEGEDVARYRDRAEYSTRAPVSLDQAQADQARRLQMGSLSLLGNAARGRAPSRAAIEGGLAQQQALQQGARAQMAKGGPGAGVVAARAAGLGTAQAHGGIAMGAGDARAREMAQARGQYVGGGLGVRGQDIGAATTNAQLVSHQQQLDEQRRQAYERLAADVQREALFGRNEQATQREQNDLALRRQRAAETQQDFDTITGWGGLGFGALSSVASASAAQQDREAAAKRGR